jgi:hypothetical protein
MGLEALLAATVGTLALACASPHPPAEVEAMLEAATTSAEVHAQLGQDHEAAELTEAVLRIDSDYEPARQLNESLPPDLDQVFKAGLLGSNRAKRVPVQRSTTSKVLLYLPDRILDLADIFSFDVHVGAGAFLNYHLTRALQAGIGLRAVTGLGWHTRRSLGNKSSAESGIALVALGAEASATTLAGTSGIFAGSETIAGLHRPSSPAYQVYRDYWAIGASATIVYLGMEWDIHPVQIADFFAGWAGVDFLNDDFAGTRGLDLSRRERDYIRNLYKLEREPETLEAYRLLREKELAEAEAEENVASPPVSAPPRSVEERLRDLERLREEQLISEDEYESRRLQLLDEL